LLKYARLKANNFLKALLMNFSNMTRDVKFNFATVGLNLVVLYSALKLGQGWIADLLSLAIFPILASFNKVSFSGGVFFNKLGDELTHKLPKHFGKWLTMTVGITGLSLFLNEISFSSGALAFFITVLSLYFMLSTCPISIISSNDAWKHKEVVFGMIPPKEQSYSTCKSNTFNKNTSPIYSYRVSNTWYRRR
jgi:uncharacterized membrane protein AbrB (regulator of aidB expression)